MMKKITILITLFFAQILQAQIYVDHSASGNNDGSTWADAFTSIQAAVDAAMNNDEIRIAQGTYMQASEISITKALTLKGGYDASDGTQEIENNPTILDGESSYRVLKYDVDANQFLEGVTIQNGFSNNDLGGAGILVKNGISVKTFSLNKVKLLNNQITGGSGGAGIFSTHNLIFTSSEISNNNASNGGGGVHSLSNITATDTKFINNAGALGGGLYTLKDATLIDVLVSNNTASDFGGGLYAIEKITLTNASIVKNSSDTSAGGIFSQSGNDAVVKNSLIALNTAPTFPQENFGISATYSFSYTQGKNPSGTGNIDDILGVFDPMFVDAANNDFKLMNASLLVNIGDPTDNRGGSDVDVDGNPRQVFCRIDIGAFENTFQRTATTFYVDKTATGTNDGTSWVNAFTTFTAAINFSSCIVNDEIQIAAGTYQEGEYVFNVAKAIKGGYPNGGGAQDVITNPTILDGNNSHRVFNTAHTVGTMNLEGLTIQNGSASDLGAGIRSIGSMELNKVMVKNNTVSSSLRILEGGGIYSSGGSLKLNNSEVINNAIDSTAFTSTPAAIGGGIYSNGSVFLTNSKVSNNSISSSFVDASGAGAGVFNRDTVILVNSEVNNNSSSFNSVSGGAGISSTNNVTLINSQVNKNTSSSSNSFSRAGGIFANGAIINLQNSILWGNTKTERATTTMSESESDSLIANHSLIKNQDPAGTGNIDAAPIDFEPLFVDEANGDFRLQTGSPLINAGLDSSNSTAQDLDGNPRLNGIIDIGPFENRSSLIGLAKNITVNGTQLTIDYYLENFNATDVTNLSLIEDFDQAFGAGNYTIIQNTQIASANKRGTSTSINFNSSFDGSSDKDILLPTSSLSSLDTIQIQLIVVVTTVINPNGGGIADYESQSEFSAMNSNMLVISDLSTSGTNPDPNNNNDPAENILNAFTIDANTPVELMSFEID